MQLFVTKGQKFLHCPGTKRQAQNLAKGRDGPVRYEILTVCPVPRDKTGQRRKGHSKTGKGRSKTENDALKKENDILKQEKYVVCVSSKQMIAMVHLVLYFLPWVAMCYDNCRGHLLQIFISRPFQLELPNGLTSSSRCQPQHQVAILSWG